MGNAALVAQARDHRRLVCAFGAQTVIDGDDVKVARRDFMQKQEQRQTVRPARYGKADLAQWRDSLPRRGKTRRGFWHQAGSFLRHMSEGPVLAEVICISPKHGRYRTGS
ncbi:hypothetical protein NVSP9465_03730 [Novosphingobium sp. CECT 9465]|nr:hypothetical protein NVSP9465_03730 [Novosphingobium sp. CECT 9465]